MRDIKKAVSKLIEQYRTNDPRLLAHYLGYIIQEGPLGQISGCHLKIEEKKFIYVNSTKQYNHKQIIIAHELGHCILHNENFYYSLDNSFCRNKAEQEACAFVQELLRPEEISYESIPSTDECNIRMTRYAIKLPGHSNLTCLNSS